MVDRKTHEQTRQAEMLGKGINDLCKASTNETLNIDKDNFDKINIYLSELQKWNKVYNLSGFKKLEDHIYRNILDCLAVAPFVSGKRLMDLGTGAGLPGMLLAILNPQQEWVLLDSNGKKTRFLNQMKQLLSLQNIEVVHSRAEQYQPEKTFDGICSRAFDKIPDSLVLCKHLFDTNAHLYALKGKIHQEDTEHLPSWAELKSTQEIIVPTLTEQRHLMTISIHQNS